MQKQLSRNPRNLYPILYALKTISFFPQALINSHDLYVRLWSDFKLSHRNIKNILSFLTKNGYLQAYKEKNSIHTFFSLTSKGEKIVSYICPLQDFVPNKDILLFVSPLTASIETGLSLKTVKNKRGFLTYITIKKTLYVIKKLSTKSLEGKEFIQKNLPHFPFVSSIKELNNIFDSNISLNFLKELLNLCQKPNNFELYLYDVYNYILLTYFQKITSPFENKIKQINTNYQKEVIKWVN